MNTIRILIVEDEKKIADSIKLGLREHGYVADAAYDGQIAWRLFASRDYDMGIIDINLPGMNGYELCRAIKQQQPDALLIILSSLGAIFDKVQGYNAGADDYLIKPFEFRELLLRINALRKRSSHLHIPVGNLLRAADLEMNLDTKQVIRGGKHVYLTAKEFQLLEYLLKNKNRVVSRSDISINVWDIDFETNTNVIDVYINYVRNKIDKGFDQKLIQTQVGMGYVLKENTY